MPSQKNVQQLTAIKEKLAQSKAVLVVDYSGTTVVDQVKLRQAIKEVGGEFYVTKNTLIRLALDKTELHDVLVGMNALVLSYQDEVAAIKKVMDFHRETEKLAVKQGLIEDRVLSPQEIEDLSKLPSKDELIATLIARLQSPGQNLVGVLKANQRQLVGVLQAIAEKDNSKE